MTEIVNHSRSIALERSVNILLGDGGLKIKIDLHGHNPLP